MFYTGVPDMAIGPLYYSLYDAACVAITEAFPDAGKSLKQTNQTPLTPAEVEEMVRLLMEADIQTVWDHAHRASAHGKSIRSLADTIQVGAAELILRTTVPRKFTEGQHPFDYCNTANYWLRTSDNPYQPRILYLMASFVNDAARANKLFCPVIGQEFSGFDLSRAHGGRRCCASRTRPSWRSTSPAPPRWPTPICRSGADRDALMGGRCGHRLQVPGRSAQPEDQPLDLRGIQPQLHASA